MINSGKTLNNSGRASAGGKRNRAGPSASTLLVSSLAAISLLFIYVPLVILVVFSFNANDVTTFPLTSWTLNWYSSAFQNELLIQALFNSIKVAIGAIVVSQLIGVPIGLALSRWDFPGKRALRSFFVMPASLPAMILGIAILNMLNSANVRMGLTTIMISHGAFMSAIVLSNVFARMQLYPKSIDEAAMDLGATPIQTFCMVTLPNIRSTLVGSALLTFTMSFDDLGIAYFVGGRENTLPMYIWSVMRTGITPEINAIATCVVLVSIVMVTMGVLLIRRN